MAGSEKGWAVVEQGLTNVLGNPSFEQDLGRPFADGTPNWDATPGRGISNFLAIGSPKSKSGRNALVLAETQAANAENLVLTFQAHPGGAGDFVTFSAWVRFAQFEGGGEDAAQMKIEFRNASGGLISESTSEADIELAAPQATFQKFTVTGSAPEGTTTIVFTLFIFDADPGENTVVVFDDVVGTISRFPIAFDTSSSKSSLGKGDATYISTRIKNVSAQTLTGLELVAQVPEGFNFIDSASRLNGAPINSREGSRIYSIGNLDTGANSVLGFLLAASNAVQPGTTYEVSLFVRDAAGVTRSPTHVILLKITSDPLFDEGTIVGKVFDDRNGNEIQDKDEYGVPGARLATEQGIVVFTDPHGRYHIPGIRPGRHVIKIDGHTLPQATRFITEEARLIKTTEGMLHVVNFAVQLPEAQIPKHYHKQLGNLLITQGNDFLPPALSVQIQPDILRMGMGYFEEPPRFVISTNYAEMINGWRMEIRDEFGEEVWTGYGIGAPPHEAPWDGRMKSRNPVKPGVYSYRLIVRDKEGREDWTPMGYFRVVSKMDKFAPDNPIVEVPAVGNMVIERDGKRSIPIVAQPRIFVRGSTLPTNEIEVNGEPVGVNLDGSFQTDLFMPPGEHSVTVTTTDPEGNAVSYQEKVTVKDSSFFMVALGEQELGVNLFDGNVQTVGNDDKFRKGFYDEGRAAYYLKGKVKGKFLVTSRYDTGDERDAIFTNLDPDHYYPVYGDDSELHYDAYDTKQRFYILVEMDRSYLKWGGYHTNFTDTELSTHNRSFSGFKLHQETLATTKYGDPKQSFTAYTADVDQFSDHNEFIETGGRAFYLRNKGVIQGSEKVRIEVRDKIQGITVYSKDLTSRADYEIDYPEGRIILSKPLFAMNFSDTILSNDLLGGSETYLIVDYEFDPQGSVSNRNSGIRAYTHVGEHLKIGGTAIEDRQPLEDYDLRGVDATLKLGRNTKVVAEYARSKNSTTRNAVSFNGGLTFSDITTGNKIIDKPTREFDDAYLVKAQTKIPKVGTEISGYAQKLEDGFSNQDLIRQVGKRKSGFQVNQGIGEYIDVNYRLDVQEATDPDNSANIFAVSPEQSIVHTAQAKLDYENLLFVGEYRNQRMDPYYEGPRSFRSILDEVRFLNGVGGKLGYRFSEDWMPYAKVQTTWGGKGEPNHQFGGGVEATVMKGKGHVRLEQLAGTRGDATSLGFDVNATEDTDVYTNMTIGPDEDGEHVMRSTMGSATQLNAKSRFYSEREMSSYQYGERMANIMGYDRTLNDQWGLGLGFERSSLYDIEEINADRTAGSLEVRYTDGDRLKVTSAYEVRYDGGSEENIHWLFRDTIDWKINEDYRYALRFNRSDTHEFNGEGFPVLGSFTELNTGITYRPVHHNKLNVLTRYTWLQDVGALNQFNTPDIFGVRVDETAHIFAVEFGYDALPPWLGLVEKLAYRRTTLKAEGDTHELSHFLWVNRLNIHVTRKWDIALEYRMLMNFELLDAMRHGIVVEIDREVMEYLRFGIGYNFTDFDDDLRRLNSFSHHGFFTRLSGKF